MSRFWTNCEMRVMGIVRMTGWPGLPGVLGVLAGRADGDAVDVDVNEPGVTVCGTAVSRVPPRPRPRGLPRGRPRGAGVVCGAAVVIGGG